MFSTKFQSIMDKMIIFRLPVNIWCWHA